MLAKQRQRSADARAFMATFRQILAKNGRSKTGSGLRGEMPFPSGDAADDPPGKRKGLLMGSRVADARAFVLRRLAAGVAPGACVSVKMTAESLEMSHTPVREALERLVGEGVLVATPGRHGFATPRLTVRDVAGLHLLHGTLMQGLNRPGARSAEVWRPDAADPVAAVRYATAPACAGAGAAMIVSAVAAAELRLSVYRRVEPDAIPDWASGLIRLRDDLSEGGAAGRRAIAAFTAARVAAADAIVAAVEDLHSASV